MFEPDVTSNGDREIKPVNNLKRTNKKDKISFFILVGLVFLLPIFFIPSASFPFLFGKSLLISLSVIFMSMMWIVDRLKDGKFTITTNPLIILGILIPFIYLLSSLFSGAIKSSLIGQGFEVGATFSIVAMFLLMFLIPRILKNTKQIYYLFFIFISSFFLISLFQILRVFMGPEFLSFGVLVGATSNLIGKWNELSIFFGLTAILSLTTIEFVHHSKLLKVLSFIILAISLFFIALVNFSLVWIILGIFAFLLVSFIVSSSKFSSVKNLGLKNKKFPIFSFVIILLALVFVIGGANIGGGLSNFFGISDTEVRPSFTGTSGIIKETLKTKSALLGVGPNRFTNQWLLHKPVGINETVFWDADFNTGVSFLVTSLVTVGLTGFILWVLFLSLLFYTGFKSIFLPQEDRAKGYLLPLTFLATVYLWIFSIIYVPSNVLMTLTFIFTGVLIALLVQNKVIKTRTVNFSDNQKTDFILVLILIFLVLVLVSTGFAISQKYIASVYSQRGFNSVQGGDIDEIERDLIKAIKLSKSDSYYRFLSEINLVKLQGLLSKKDISEEELRNQFQLILGEAVGNAKTSTEIDKTNYQNWVALGRVYETVILFGIPGAYDQAVDSYINAINLNPRSPLLMFNLGVLEYNNKNYDNAFNVLERAVILKPTYSDAKYFLGLTYYNLGRTDEAIMQFEDVDYLNPDNNEVETILENLKKGNSPFRGVTNIETVSVPKEDVSNEEE